MVNSEFENKLKQGYTQKQLSDFFGVSTKTIYKWQEDVGITTTEVRNRIKRETFLKLAEDGCSQTEIAKRLEVTPKTIYNWCKRDGIKLTKKTNRKNLFDIDFFEEIDSEVKSYILGFAMADGFIQSGNKGLSFTLAEKDRSQLENIAKAMGFPGEIRKAKRNRCTLNLCSKKMANDLSEYGVVKNKTETMFLPDIDDKFKRHLIRGYFDGDGYVGERQCVLVVSSKQFKDDLFEYISSLGFLLPSIKINNGKSISLVFSRKHYPFIDYIYDNSNVFLARKKQSYLDNWKPYSIRDRSRG